MKVSTVFDFFSFLINLFLPRTYPPQNLLNARQIKFGALGSERTVFRKKQAQHNKGHTPINQNVLHREGVEYCSLIVSL